MNEKRLSELLDRFPRLHVLVVGDFFLDKYLMLDRRLSEVSLETGLEAYQVVGVRCSPGAAGTVTSNLRALGVQVTALGVIGDDGEGYELKRGLAESGVNIELLIQRADLFTPTYTKPMMRESDGQKHEIERFDIKSRSSLPADAEEQVIARLRTLVPKVGAVVIADQVTERDCGVITDRVREEMGQLALRYPGKIFAADSRRRIGFFRHVIIKPNRHEAILAALGPQALYSDRPGSLGPVLRPPLVLGPKDPGYRTECPRTQGTELSAQGLRARPDWPGEFTLDAARDCGAELFRRNQKPVFLTVGSQGILLFTEQGCQHVPAVSVEGEVDIVGAGDSVMAGIVSALGSGAEPGEAALLGNIVASITIQQIGTTGTASPAQVRERFRTQIRGKEV